MYIIGQNYTTNNADIELFSNLGNYLPHTPLQCPTKNFIPILRNPDNVKPMVILGMSSLTVCLHTMIILVPRLEVEGFKPIRGLSLHQLVLEGVFGQLRIILHPHFFQHPSSISTDGFYAQAQFFSNIRYCFSRSNHTHHLKFTV